MPLLNLDDFRLEPFEVQLGGETKSYDMVTVALYFAQLELEDEDLTPERLHAPVCKVFNLSPSEITEGQAYILFQEFYKQLGPAQGKLAGLSGPSAESPSPTE